MKKYIIPSVNVLDVQAENMLALSTQDKVSSKPQLTRGWSSADWSADEEEDF